MYFEKYVLPQVLTDLCVGFHRSEAILPLETEFNSDCLSYLLCYIVLINSSQDSTFITLTSNQFFASVINHAVSLHALHLPTYDTLACPPLESLTYPPPERCTMHRYIYM